MWDMVPIHKSGHIQGCCFEYNTVTRVSTQLLKVFQLVSLSLMTSWPRFGISFFVVAFGAWLVLLSHSTADSVHLGLWMQWFGNVNNFKLRTQICPGPPQLQCTIEQLHC